METIFEALAPAPFSFILSTNPGGPYEQFGRALWNLLAPVHGEPPIYALGDAPFTSFNIDLADCDAITGPLPLGNPTGQVASLACLTKARQ